MFIYTCVCVSTTGDTTPSWTSASSSPRSRPFQNIPEPSRMFQHLSLGLTGRLFASLSHLDSKRETRFFSQIIRPSWLGLSRQRQSLTPL